MGARNETDDLEARVRDRLDQVLDPCSTFTDKPQSIVDLGLVDGVDLADGEVTVDLLPTNQLCMYIPHMTEDIENRVGELPRIDSVTVDIIPDKVWTQDRMSEAAYGERKQHFRNRVTAHELSPAYDGEEWDDNIETESVQER